MSKTHFTSLEKNSKGLILKVGHRKSQRSSKIYEDKRSLRFKYQISRPLSEKFHYLLKRKNFNEFEDKLSEQFFLYFGKLLPFEFSYLDWLVIKLRTIRDQQIPSPFLKVDYLESKHFSGNLDPKELIMLLQFFTYVSQQPYHEDFSGKTAYRLVIFRLDHFLKAIYPTLVLFFSSGVSNIQRYDDIDLSLSGE